MIMLEQSWFVSVLEWGEVYINNLIWTLVMLVLYVFITKVTLPKIEEKVSQSNFKSEEATKAYHMIRMLAGVLTLSAVLIVWGIDFSGLLVISTSLITLTGVALFASWSLLSNITCYFLILFHTSFRRGNFIRILDGDNYLEGSISEVGLFNTKLETEYGETIIYPNNLILNRPTIVNPKHKCKPIGKTTDFNDISHQKNEEIAGTRGPNTR